MIHNRSDSNPFAHLIQHVQIVLAPSGELEHVLCQIPFGPARREGKKRQTGKARDQTDAQFSRQVQINTYLKWQFPRVKRGFALIA